MSSSNTPLWTLIALLATVAASSASVAYASTRFAALWFLPLDAEGLETAPRRVAAANAGAQRAERDPSDILRRNIFDSVTGDLLTPKTEATEEGNSSEESPSSDWDPSQPLASCDGGLRLVGALVHRRSPERSFAAISTGSGGETDVYHVSGTINDRTLRAVHSSSVVLQSGSGTPCRLAMFDPSRQPARPARATTPAVAATRTDNRGGPDSETLDQGIQKVNDNEYTIQRSLLDELLEDQAGLMKLARVIPHQENGRTVGVKLYGIRRNSVLGRLGIHNGDMLRNINGFDMADATGALEAFAKLRSADNLSVSLVRRGNPQTFEYAIQ